MMHEAFTKSTCLLGFKMNEKNTKMWFLIFLMQLLSTKDQSFDYSMFTNNFDFCQSSSLELFLGSINYGLD